MIKKSVLSLAVSALGIAFTPLCVPSVVFAQQSNIVTSSLCGTWQAVPGSGDFIYGPEEFPVKKVQGVIHGTINYDVHTLGKRTLRVNQAVSLETPLNADGSRLSGGKTRTINVVQKYHGAVQGDSVYFTEDNQSETQKWLRLPGNKFDVIVLHSGKYPSASQYIIQQTASRACK